VEKRRSLSPNGVCAVEVERGGTSFLSLGKSIQVANTGGVATGIEFIDFA
jgi:hypothetical protein